MHLYALVPVHKGLMKLEVFLKKHIRGMLECFCLTNFDVTTKVVKTKCLAEIDVDLEYLSAKILYGKALKRAWEKGDKELVLTTLAHEITHILLETLAETPGSKSKKHRIALEQATEHISRLLYRLYRKET